MNENNIKTQVLDKIKSGKISMRPKFYYILKVVSLIFVAFVTLIISSFLVSFIIFSIVEGGKLFVLGFGLRGFYIFFLLFPWNLLLIEIVFLILLQWLVKQFKFGYRSSLTTLLLIVLCISIGISILIELTPIHPALLHRAEHRDLPFFGNLYRDIHRPPGADGLVRGTISTVGTSSFIMVQTIDADDGSTTAQTTNVILPIPQNTVGLSVGDTVLVVGQQLKDHIIHAFGIQKLLSLPADNE